LIDHGSAGVESEETGSKSRESGVLFACLAQERFGVEAVESSSYPYNRLRDRVAECEERGLLKTARRGRYLNVWTTGQGVSLYRSMQSVRNAEGGGMADSTDAEERADEDGDEDRDEGEGDTTKAEARFDVATWLTVPMEAGDSLLDVAEMVHNWKNKLNQRLVYDAKIVGIFRRDELPGYLRDNAVNRRGVASSSRSPMTDSRTRTTSSVSNYPVEAVATRAPSTLQSGTLQQVGAR